MNLEQARLWPLKLRAQFFLKELYKQMMVKEAMYQQFLREKWKIK
ncbi:hypothetical protein NG792_07985 [Laspinema sp. C3]|uniref:Uncharacterized protein n=1 Tax=Laspinema olomoucense D3b TaxID=2953688 RepID=A0ABT2N7E2_9CYAN|nr:hypothetical protein [Laspinema sp. D3b]